MVEELKEFWFGKQVQLGNGSSVFMKAALALISCNIPALRKVVGFVGHAARLGCSKCLKEFPSINLKTNYGGFDCTYLHLCLS